VVKGKNSYGELYNVSGTSFISV